MLRKALLLNLIFWSLGPWLCHGQVVGVQPTPIGLYQWNGTGHQFNPLPNTYGLFPAQSTPQPFAFYGWNSTLHQWLPCDTVTASCPLTGVFKLTTNGTSGVATYDGTTLNIPNYSAGAGGGTIPSNAVFVFACTSGCDDDNHVLSPNLTVTSYSAQVGGLVTFVNTGTNNFSVGDWVNVRFLNGWNANLPSGMILGTGHTLFQVATTDGVTNFTLNVGSLTETPCSSSCGFVESAMSYNPFIMAKRLAFPANAVANTYVMIANPVTIPGMASNYAVLYHPLSPAQNSGRPAYLIVMDHTNDDSLCADPASVVQPAYLSLFAQAHVDNYTVVAGTGVSFDFNQITSGCHDNSLKFNANRKWLISQGPTAATRATGQYWDMLTDTSTATLDGSDILMQTWGSDAQQAVGNALAATIGSGGSPVTFNPFYWGAPSNSVNYGMRWALYTDDSYGLTLTNNSGGTAFYVDTNGPGTYVYGTLHVAWPGICPNFALVCFSSTFLVGSGGDTHVTAFYDTGEAAASGTNYLQIGTDGHVTKTTSAPGTTTVYRCATAGAAPNGTLTTDSTQCGTSADTGLRVQ